MKDIIYMNRGIDGAFPLSFVERSVELARIQANEHGLDRISVWVKPDKVTRSDPDGAVVAMLWSADETPPSCAYDLDDLVYLGVFTVEPLEPEQKLMSQSGALV